MGIPPVNFSSSSLVTPLLVYTCVLAYMFFFLIANKSLSPSGPPK